MLVNVYHHHLHRNWQPQTQRHAHTHRSSFWLELVRLVFFMGPLCLRPDYQRNLWHAYSLMEWEEWISALPREGYGSYCKMSWWSWANKMMVIHGPPTKTLRPAQRPPQARPGPPTFLEWQDWIKTLPGKGAGPFDQEGWREWVEDLFFGFTPPICAANWDEFQALCGTNWDEHEAFYLWTSYRQCDLHKNDLRLDCVSTNVRAWIEQPPAPERYAELVDD